MLLILGLELMMSELESACLEVVLVPSKRYANTGGCIRVAANKNCSWYRRFCARHLSSRHRRNNCIDTCIKRKNTEHLLERLIAGKPSRSKYVDELLTIATHEITA